METSRGTAGGRDVGWRFKGHGEGPFWRWVASWARAIRKPSDMRASSFATRVTAPTGSAREHPAIRDTPSPVRVKAPSDSTRRHSDILAVTDKSRPEAPCPESLRAHTGSAMRHPDRPFRIAGTARKHPTNPAVSSADVNADEDEEMDGVAAVGPAPAPSGTPRNWLLQSRLSLRASGSLKMTAAKT